MMVSLAIPYTAPDHGWGGPVAILVAFAAMGVIHIGFERQKNRAHHSPTPPPRRGHGVNRQVTEVPDTDDTPWWGRIVTIDGVRMRQFRQVLRTGSSSLPEDQLEDRDDDVDLDLDDAAPQDLDSWVRDNLATLGYAELVRAGQARWRVSERTMKRRIADAKAER